MKCKRLFYVPYVPMWLRLFGCLVGSSTFRRIEFAFTFLFTCSAILASAQLKPMADSLTFVKGLEQFSKNTTSIQGDFVQEKKLKILKDKVTSRGTLLFKKEDKLRWAYTEPYPYIVAMNGGQVMMKDGDKVTRYDAASNRLFMELNDLLITCINGNIFQSKKFSFRLFENDKYNVSELTPLQPAMKNFISQILLYFDKNDFTVARVEMTEPSGNSTVIVFKNKKRNADMPDSHFVLQ